MENLTIEINGKTFKAPNSYFIIESNHGNHSGFNRTWKIWNDIYSNKKSAMCILSNHFDNLYSNNPDYISEDFIEGGEYDLRYFKVVDLNKLESTLNGTNSPISHWAFDQINFPFED